MAKTLEYINSLSRGSAKFDTQSDKKDHSLQQTLINELIITLNKPFYTGLWHVLIHVSYLTFNPIHTQFMISSVFMALVAVKLFQYCRFMDSQHR
jgi:hypothetical protein